MHRLGFFRVTIRDDERGVLRRDGRFAQFLAPGRFVRFDPRREYTCEVFNVMRSTLPADTALLLARTQPDVARDHLEIVQTDSETVALVSIDGQARHFVPPNAIRAFWTTLADVSVERINTRETMVVAPEHLARLDLSSSHTVVHSVVEAHEAGLLFVDGALAEILPAGHHAYWAVGRTVRIQKMDMRPIPLEVTAQEILTKDRVGIRVTLTAFFKIEDVRQAAIASQDVPTTLYRLIQFAIREAVAARTLDEILAARDTLDQQVRDYVSARAEDLGASIGEIGVKDIILPGDVRELLNKVVEAERTAKANLIRRQEETAATRSLLNTSKLMEDNPLLLRLKELEALEKLVEKVGNIDLHAGDGTSGALQALMRGLYRLGDDDGGGNSGAGGSNGPRR